MRLVTWNVNSIRARQERVLAWLAVQRPTLLCLQETKVTDEAFPRDAFGAAGYHVTTAGQRTYSGVALLSRTPPRDVVRQFADGEDETAARFLSARVDDVRVLCVYVPNGRVVSSEQFTYKLAWLGRLRRYLDRHGDPDGFLAVCGDLNIAPEPRDVHDPLAWQGTVLFHPRVREALQQLCAWGLVDAVRLHHPEGGLYKLVGLPRPLLCPKPRSAHRPHPSHTFLGSPVHGGRDRPRGAQGSEGLGPCAGERDLCPR